MAMPGGFGAGQLSAALEAVADFKTRPPMLVSLAKKEEEIYVPGSSEPLKLSRTNVGLKLAQAEPSAEYIRMNKEVIADAGK